MKNQFKQFILSSLTVLVMSYTQSVRADINSDAETLLNWAENTFPEYFPSHQITQGIDNWLFRYYPETGTYAGINKDDNNVYVLGGVWDSNEPTFIDSLASLLASIDQNGGNGSIPACDTAQIPEGMVYTQNGNVINVTTNGQCIKIPAGNNVLCNAPAQATPTGISFITDTTITDYKMSGITMSIPGLPNPFESSGLFSGKHCIINAPSEMSNQIINHDICVDITDNFSDIPSNEFMTITPPITVATKGTTTNTQVSDCFNTDADSISNTVTGELYIKQNGSFVKIN